MEFPNHVFIVDDDPSVRKGFTNLLRAAGYFVKDFATVMEYFTAVMKFQDFFEQDISGCLLLEIKTPGISNEELVTKMKNCASRLSIIVVSATDDQESRELAKEIGAIGFFRKPVDGTALIDLIKWELKSDSTRNDHDKFIQ